MTATILTAAFELIQFLILFIFIYYVNKNFRIKPSDKIISKKEWDKYIKEIVPFVNKNREYIVDLNNEFQEFKTNCNKSFEYIMERLDKNRGGI